MAKEPVSQSGVKVEGTISLADGKAATEAVLSAINLESGKAFRADPTGAGGRFHLSGLPYGYYVFAVEAHSVLHASAYPFNVPPGEKCEVDLILSEPGASASEWATEIVVPTLDRTAKGIIDVVEPTTPFLKKPAGIATIVGASLLLLLLK